MNSLAQYPKRSTLDTVDAKIKMSNNYRVGKCEFFDDDYQEEIKEHVFRLLNGIKDNSKTGEYESEDLEVSKAHQND